MFNAVMKNVQGFEDLSFLLQDPQNNMRNGHRNLFCKVYIKEIGNIL